VWAYGGLNGQRGSRDGDIGTERQPVSEYFQLQPAFCRSNEFQINGDEFTLRSRLANMAGLMPPGSKLEVANATQWASIDGLLESAGQPGSTPVVVGQVGLQNGQPLYLALQRIPGGAGTQADLATYQEVARPRPGQTNPPPEERFSSAPKIQDLPGIFAAATEHRRELSEKIVVQTPDPFVNAAAAALCLAADGVWDERQGAVMHGAVAWRTKLLGWRGRLSQRRPGLARPRPARFYLLGRATGHGRDTRRDPARRPGLQPLPQRAFAAQQRRHVQFALRHEPGLY
jgi:hypothetical protein